MKSARFPIPSPRRYSPIIRVQETSTMFIRFHPRHENGSKPTPTVKTRKIAHFSPVQKTLPATRGVGQQTFATRDARVRPLPFSVPPAATPRGLSFHPASPLFSPFSEFLSCGAKIPVSAPNSHGSGPHGKNNPQYPTAISARVRNNVDGVERLP